MRGVAGATRFKHRRRHVTPAVSGHPGRPAQDVHPLCRVACPLRSEGYENGNKLLQRVLPEAQSRLVPSGKSEKSEDQREKTGRAVLAGGASRRSATSASSKPLRTTESHSGGCAASGPRCAEGEG